MSFLPCGLTTLLTDLGLGDPSIGIVKGVMISRFAQLKIVDLCHHVPRHDVVWAAYVLAGSYRNFPPGTVHCAIVAAGGSKHDDILVADHGGHVFVALDNGILTQVLEDRGVVYRVDLSRVPVAPVRRTLHTRDIVAPIGALLASGKLAVEDCGPEEPDPKRIRTWPTEADGDTIDGVVVGEDRFGNLFTTLSEQDVPVEGDYALEVAGRTVNLVSGYGEAESGEALALFNGFGMLEIAIRDGKASTDFEWERGTAIRVRLR